LFLFAACGGGGGHTPDAPPPSDAPPMIDAPVFMDAPADAPPTFTLTSIFPSAASRTVDTALTINGTGINGTPTIHLVNCDVATTTYDLTPTNVTSTSITTTLAADTTRVQGLYSVDVTNGDGMMASLHCALHILAEPPPTVTLVVPTTAWQGVAMDDINSDKSIAIQGTGFMSTPNVRWVSTTDPSIHFDASFVGYVSATQITAVVPAETQMMPAGTYNVFVTNPDQLTGEWMNGATPGIFTITATPPPDITDISPARIPNGTCSETITFTGTGFDAAATLWIVVPTGTTCTGSSTDANGQTLCPITVDSSMPTSMTGHFATCPALGPYPVVVENPDGQSDYFYDIEITPSSDGHLNTGPWTTETSTLVVPRYKHAAQYGFDSFSNAFMYVAGGQDASGNVLGSVEISQFDLFGTPAPFELAQQYGDPTNPRVENDLGTPREGLTLVRAGKSMFAIGGTTTRSDSTTPVAASNVVERAEILGYDQMPGLKQPTSSGTTGLPVGSWYYRISAVGPWGESLATREVVAINQGNQVLVCWVAPTAMGATSYNLYRSLASDGRANTSAAIAYEINPTNLCITDDGSEKLAPAPGNLRGTLAAGGSNPAGTYTYRVSAIVPLTAGGTWETYAGYASATTIAATDVTAGNQTVNVAWDAIPNTGATYRLYRLDTTDNTYKMIADALTATTFADTGVAFDASNTQPRTEIHPLPTGSLSKWSATGVPALNTAREGLDGVVVTMDPATSNNEVARIVVAGGRDGAGGTYSYFKTAESLGVYADGTLDTSWFDETSQFTHARAYYALVTTQDRNTTPFPPPPEPPPCGDCTTVIQRKPHLMMPSWMLPVRTKIIYDVASAEPVYLVAVMGDDAFAATNNAGRDDFEACSVDQVTGHLSCGASWVVQTNNLPTGDATFGEDAVLYFSYMYPFSAIRTETVGAPGDTISLLASAIGRFPLVADLTMVTAGQILDTFQSASTSFNVARAYYQMSRLLAYVYVIGGDTATGPTGTVERHQQ
jgi:hypothetical protein